MNLIGALNKAAKAGETVKKAAPFYSAVDEAMSNLKRPKGTGIEFLTEVLKQPGVKKAEIADRKLEQAFKAKGKMTKEEAQQVLKDNPPPQVEDRHLREISDYERDKMLEEKLETSGYDYMGEVPAKKLRQWNDEIDQDLEKYGDYKTAGGQNYREILLKLPQTFTDKEANRIMALEADLRRGEIPESQMQELIALKNKQLTSQPDYRTSHWNEDPNVLAHMRVQDRKGPNGEKILHVEEIQSDWHQAGRKKGYRNQEAIDKAKQAFDDYNKNAKERLRQIMLKESEGEMAPDRALTYVDNFVNGMDPSGVAGFLNEKPAFVDLYRATKGIGGSEIPDAPFKKNWHELAMKRLLNYAAENDYDSIAITPGAEQAKRYDLSKQVDDLQVYRSPDGTFDIKATLMRDASTQNVGNKIAPEQLSDYVGQSLAEKLLQQSTNTKKFYSGEDLSVGGEGMKGFYDKMLPDYLNTFGKPYGAQVGRLELPTGEKMVPDNAGLGMIRSGEQNMLGYHNFPITPEMRESIKQKGLPLYQQVGIPTAGAGAASQMLEPQEEPQYAKGGTVKPQVKKSVSGTVKMTNNRDAMFMELSNKKLKRK